MKCALVTGGCGYIGSYLVEALLAKGWRVHVLDTLFAAKVQGFVGNVYMQSASVANVDAVARSMKGVSVVFHLAARSDWNEHTRHPLRLAKTNIEGTATILALAHAAGVHNVVMTSSAAVYGDLAGGSEIDYVEPISAYGATKLAAESLGHYYNSCGLEVKILRLFNVWGRKRSCSAVNHFANGYNTIFGSGSQTRDFVHVNDAVDAIINAQVWDPGIYNIGTGEEVAISGLYSMLRDDEPKMVEEKPFDIFRSFADTSLTVERTKWQAKTLLSGLTREQIVEMCNG